jgi:hypothetical protein
MVNRLKGLLLVLDGLVLPLFEEMIKRGRMPNVSEHVIGRKILNIKNAFSCHPSSTYENMQAINTGRFPLDPGATYFSSSTASIVDLLRVDNPSKGFCAKRRTIFHHIPNSVSIHNPWNDGADDKHPGVYSLGSAGYALGWEGSNFAAVQRYLQTLKSRKPSFAEIWFPAYDRFAHTLPESKLLKKYERFDRHFGRIVKGMKETGTYDDTIIIILSDHGMGDVSCNINPNELVLDAGLKPKIARRNKEFNSRVFAYGYSIGQLYLTGLPERELERRLVDLVNQKPVEHVIRRVSDNVKIVYSKDAVVQIERADSKYRMVVLSGANPFGYSDSLTKKLGEYRSAKESLELTSKEEQPDAVVGIAEGMNHPDAPPVRFLAANGYAFGKIRNGTHFPAYFNANRIRTHGNLHRKQSQIPMMIAGPKGVIDYREVDCARVIDWMPTFLDIAGYKTDDKIDGVSLLSI